MYNAFWRHALFVRGQSSSVKPFDRSRNGCQVIRLGAREKRFSGAFRAGALSPIACLLLVRPFFLVPTTSKRLLRRLHLLVQFERKKDKYANSKWNLRNLFCWRSNLSNDDMIYCWPGQAENGSEK